MKRNRYSRAVFLAVIILLTTIALSQQSLGGRVVRGKGPALPLSERIDERQQLTQDLALSDSAVQAHTIGHRSEVFTVSRTGHQFTERSAECAAADCRQVNIYNWDEDAAVTAIVNLDTRQVLDVLYLPSMHPAINTRLSDLAIELAINDPEVIELLGFRPDPDDVDMVPVDAGAPGTSCDGSHYCVAPTFALEDRILWVMVDLTDELVAGIRWTLVDPASHNELVTFTPDSSCPQPGSVQRDGWSLQHEVTSWDGLRVFDVTYQGKEVLTSVKLAEWHADYGATGFEDSTGCSSGGGGYTIYPFGDTQILDLLDDQQNVIGFEVVQDFRMPSWGNNCNYRYEQHNQFYADGRFRIVGGAFGKGCGSNALYRPLVRIDVAVDGDANDNFAYFDGLDWVDQTTEMYRAPELDPNSPHYLTAEGYAWRVTDYDAAAGYYLEPGVGQFDDGGRGDEPFIYALLHRPSEGDTDIGVIGFCCYDNYQQGPHIYLNGESIENANIVLWYVPQMETDAIDGGNGFYCWTEGDAGNPGPAHPCFAGPMFHPFELQVDTTFYLFLPDLAAPPLTQ